MPEMDFTFLRRPDGHEVGGIFGNPAAARSTWNTTFEVADTDAAVAAALAHGGKSDGASDILYGRIATVLDPFGAEFSVITEPLTVKPGRLPALPVTRPSAAEFAVRGHGRPRVLGDEVGVDLRADEQASRGRGDHLGIHVGHVAGHPDARHRGRPGRFGGDDRADDVPVHLMQLNSRPSWTSTSARTMKRGATTSACRGTTSPDRRRRR